MAVTRIPHRLPLRPDLVRIEVDDGFKTDLAQQQTLRDILRATSPRGRIDRLRRHEELKAHSNDLQRLLDAGHDVLAGINELEAEAKEIDDTPGLLRDAARQAGTKNSGQARAEKYREIEKFVVDEWLSIARRRGEKDGFSVVMAEALGKMEKYKKYKIKASTVSEWISEKNLKKYGQCG